MAATRNLLYTHSLIRDAADIAATDDQLLFDLTAEPLLAQSTAPIFTPTGEGADVVQGATTATTLLQSANISDPDGPGEIVEAIITIANAQAGDTLSLPGVSGGTVDGGAITVTGLGGSTLTLTGAASISEYDSLLATVTYRDVGTDPTSGSHPTRTIDWTVDDGVLSSAVATTTVTIDRAPTVTTDSPSVTFDGGQSTPTTLDSGLLVTDLDGGNLAGATVTISSGYISGDTLNFTPQNGITGSFANGKLVLSGAATIANYQAALDSVAYGFSPANGDPTGGGSATSRTISWTVNDGVTNSATTTSALSIVHEPPVLAADGTADYSEIGDPVALDPNVTVSDPDSGSQLRSAVVQISSGFETGDTLNYSLEQTNGITPSFNFFSHSYVFSGLDTLADYQALLSSLTFSTTAGDTSPTSRTITWSIYDGVAFNATVETSTVEVTPCFVRGTRILTGRGEVAVEDLKVDDLAITASGARRAIVWIGHRVVDITRHPDPAAVRPVRISAGAFGKGLPRRDLWLSPGHNLACDGALIAAGLLLNGASAAQVEQDRVEYWHVELNSHDILVAEGLEVESYLDAGNRTAFANGGAFIDVHPYFRPKHWTQTCLPQVFDGPAVTATKSRLLARLAERGFQRTHDARPHIHVDGVRIDPVRLGEMRLAFALPSEGREICLRSRTFVPAQAIAESSDLRALGLCVAAMQIDGSAVSLGADMDDAQGWHDGEHDGENFTHRWTNGGTPLPSGARIVIIDLAGVGCYLPDQKEHILFHKTLARP